MDILVYDGFWGDCGKGKIVDFLAEKKAKEGNLEAVVRFAGGGNAGHTVVLENNDVLRLNLIPSGIAIPDVYNALLSKVLVNPLKLMEEIKRIEEDYGIEITPEKFGVSGRCKVTLPFHIDLDVLNSKIKGRDVSTKRGIAPTQADNVSYNGMTMAEFVDELTFTEVLEEQFHRIDELYKHFDTSVELDVESYKNELGPAMNFLRKFIIDEAELVENKKGDWIFEGAQGTLLSPTYGNYPDVTATEPYEPPSYFEGEKYMVLKSFVSRVGAAPRVGVVPEHVDKIIRGEPGSIGEEIGATTGRKRDLMWFDAIAAKHSALLTNPDILILTKLDMLSGVNELEITTGYDTGDGIINHVPQNRNVYKTCAEHNPETMKLVGWSEDIGGIKEWEYLPENAKNYVATIEKLLDHRVGYVSVGTGRHDIIEVPEYRYAA
ncbi:MAG: adenylosuccinate synthetase [Nanoarchaeota archaeon]